MSQGSEADREKSVYDGEFLGYKEVFGEYFNPDVIRVLLSYLFDLSGKSFKITVVSLVGQRWEITVKGTTTVATLRQECADRLFVGPKKVRLNEQTTGRRLEEWQDAYTLRELHVGAQSRIQPVIKLSGDIGVFQTAPDSVTARWEDRALCSDDDLVSTKENQWMELLDRFSAQNTSAVSLHELWKKATCEKLIARFSTTMTGVDFQCSISLVEIKEILEPAELERVQKLIDFTEIRYRCVSLPGKYIPFHVDVAKVTLHVSLNTEDEFVGGRTVFVTKDGTVWVAPRQPGWGTLHDGRTVHGVTGFKSGRRESLFFLKSSERV